MSQRAVFAEVDGTLYPEVLHSMPVYDDCVSMAKEMGISPERGGAK